MVLPVCFSDLLPVTAILNFPVLVAKDLRLGPCTPLVAREARDTHERLRPHFSLTNHHPPFGSCDPLSTNQIATCKRGQIPHTSPHYY